MPAPDLPQRNCALAHSTSRSPRCVASGFEKVRLTDGGQGTRHQPCRALCAFREQGGAARCGDRTLARRGRCGAAAFCERPGEPVEKLRAWFVARTRVKVDRARQDPELYRSFDFATAQDKPFVRAHRAEIDRQLDRLLAEAGGETGGNRGAILTEAMTAFLHPSLVAQHLGEDRERLMLSVLGTVLAGFGVHATSTGRERRPGAERGNDDAIPEILHDD